MNNPHKLTKEQARDAVEQYYHGGGRFWIKPPSSVDHQMKETSTDYVPEGYIQEQEPFKLTEEEYQWLISLCCPGRA